VLFNLGMFRQDLAEQIRPSARMTEDIESKRRNGDE
jgi:hypothetical protein